MGFEEAKTGSGCIAILWDSATVSRLAQEMDEEPEETFALCMEAFLLALKGFFRKEFFPEDHSRAEQVTDRTAMEFDKDFKPFITTFSEKEN